MSSLLLRASARWAGDCAVTRPGGVLWTGLRAIGNVVQPGAPNVSMYYKEDEKLTPEALQWYQEHQPPGATTRAATAPNPDIGNIQPAPLYRENQREREPDTEPKPDRPGDDFSRGTTGPSGAIPIPGMPRAMNTAEYWRADLPLRSEEPAAALDRTARPESSGDANYE